MMPLRVVMQTIEHKDQRYPTCGDWIDQDFDMALAVKVSRTGNDRMDVLLMLHEFVEAVLCRMEGIRSVEVDKFDQGEGQYVKEPGSLPNAPYHTQHCRAEIIERLMADWLDVDWDDYGHTLEQLDVKKEG